MATSKPKTIDITKTGPLGFRQLQASNEDEFSPEYKSFIEGVEKAHPINSLYNPFSHAEQQVASPLNEGNIRWGESRYDKGVASEEEFQHYLGDVRAEAQPWYNKVLSGLAKGAILAGTTFLDGTVGLAVGIGTAVGEGRWSGLWDNDFSRAMQSINEAAEEAMPNYYSNEELNNPWYENIFTANFIGDKFIKNLGFTVGAFYSGNVWAKGLQATRLPNLIGKAAMSGAGKSVKAAEAAYAAGEVGSAAKLESAIAQVGRALDAPAHVTSGVGAVMSAINEGRIEALNNSKDWYEYQKLQIDDYYKPQFDAIKQEYEANKGKALRMEGNPEFGDVRYVDPAYETYQAKVSALQSKYEDSLAKLNEDRLKMGNADLLMNIPILTASNIIQFGKLYANGYKTARKGVNLVNKGKFANMSAAEALAAAKEAGMSVEEFAREFAQFSGKEAKKGLVGTLGRVGGRMASTALPEGTEEISQKAASSIAGDYYATDVHNFYRAKTDPDASEETLSWLKSFAHGINETINDGSSWEEFFIGALTGALGMPVFGNANTSAADTYLGKGKAVGLRGGILGAGLEAKATRQREQNIANYINERIQSPEFKNYYQSLNRHNAFQNEMNAAAEAGDEFTYKNAEHKQLISDIMMFDNAGKIGDLLTLINAAYDTSPENLASIVKNTTSVIEVTGKKQLIGPYAEYATLSDDGKVVPNFGSEEQQKEMAQKLTKSRDEFLKTITDYQTAKDEIDILTGQRLSDDQLQELTWIKTQSKNWNERGSELAKETRSTLSYLVGDITARRSLLDSVKRHEGASHVERTEAYDKLSEAEKREADNQRVLDTLLALDDQALFSVLGDESSAQNREAFKKLVELSPSISPTDSQRFSQALDDMVKLKNGIDSFNKKLDEYLKNPEQQAAEMAAADATNANKEVDKKRNAVARRINFDAPTAEVAKALEENAKDIEAMGGFEEFIKTLPVAEREKAKKARRFTKGLNSLKDSVESSDLTDEQKRLANKLIDDNTSGTQDIGELGKKIAKALNEGAIRDELVSAVSAAEGVDDLLIETKLAEAEGKLKEFFDDKIEKVAAAVSNAEKTDTDAIKRAADALDKKEKELAEAEKAAESKVAGIPIARAAFKAIDEGKLQDDDEKGKAGYKEVHDALAEVRTEVAKGKNTKAYKEAVRKLIATAKKNPDLKASKFVLDKFGQKMTVPTEPTTDFVVPEEGEVNAPTEAKDVKDKNTEKAIPSPNSGLDDAAYNTRPQLTQYYMHGRDGLTYIAYLEAALADPQKYPNAFPNGIADKEAYVKYIRATWEYLNSHNAFDYVSGVNPEDKLKVGDPIEFKRDPQLDKAAGVPVVLMVTKNAQGEEQVIGSLPSSLDFEAHNRKTDKPEKEVRPAQYALYQEVLKRNVNPEKGKVTTYLEKTIFEEYWTDSTQDFDKLIYDVERVQDGRKVSTGNRALKLFDAVAVAIDLGLITTTKEALYANPEKTRVYQDVLIDATQQLRSLGVNTLSEFLSYLQNLAEQEKQAEEEQPISREEVEKEVTNLLTEGGSRGLALHFFENQENLVAQFEGKTIEDYDRAIEIVPKIISKLASEGKTFDEIMNVLVNDSRWLLLTAGDMVRPTKVGQYLKKLLSEREEKPITTKVRALRGGMIMFGNNESSVASIFGDATPVIAALGEDSTLTTGDPKLDAQLVSPGGLESNAVAWGIYAMVPANNGKYLPALCYSTKLSDIIGDPNDWYIQQTVEAIMRIPKRITDLRENIKAVYKWIPIPGLSIQIGNVGSDGRWVNETSDIGNAKFVRISYSSPNNRDGKPMMKFLTITNGELSDVEIRTKLAEIVKQYPNITTNVDIKKLTDRPEHQEYRRNIARYLHTNIMSGKSHTVNDWFNYEPTEIERNATLKQDDKKKDGKPDVEKKPQAITVTIEGQTYTVVGTHVEDANGRPVSNDVAQKVLSAAAKPIDTTPVEPPKPKGNTAFMSFNMGGDTAGPTIGSRQARVRSKRHKNLAVTDTEDAVASVEVTYENAETVRKMFPQLSDAGRVVIVNGLIRTVDETGNPIKAYGQFRDGILYISNQSPAGTAYHEAFHYVTTMLMNEQEQAVMLDAAREKYGNLSDIALEEKLAEDFREYMNGYDDKSIIGRLKTFFRNLKHLIQNLAGRATYLDNLFYDIYRNKYSSRTEVLNNDTFEEDLVKYKDSELSYNKLDAQSKEMLQAKKVSPEDYEKLTIEDKENVLFCLI